MKTQSSQKFFSLTMILGMFVIGSLVGPVNGEKLTTINQSVKLTSYQQDYWVRWNHQFSWAKQGKFNAVRLPLNEGC